ncbi:hypothetical protein QAD02_003553 [Eretmocerus hayati]|uniref:Uncharacterized protein n=1 Tax=Eretmocerus hayati TaxID=131215 RepID=A0ACC2NM23_9HYME|nr:hypothetical protein QAD02_003553 [Eretmocerus hayati]
MNNVRQGERSAELPSWLSDIYNASEGLERSRPHAMSPPRHNVLGPISSKMSRRVDTITARAIRKIEQHAYGATEGVRAAIHALGSAPDAEDGMGKSIPANSRGDLGWEQLQGNPLHLISAHITGQSTATNPLEEMTRLTLEIFDAQEPRQAIPQRQSMGNGTPESTTIRRRGRPRKVKNIQKPLDLSKKGEETEAGESQVYWNAAPKIAVTTRPQPSMHRSATITSPPQAGASQLHQNTDPEIAATTQLQHSMRRSATITSPLQQGKNQFQRYQFVES